MNKIEKVVNTFGLACKEKHYSIVLAESCTGGGMGYFISRDSEISSILERGFIVYSDAAKEMLGVTQYSLQTFGPVSKEVAIEMANSALEKSKAQISFAITGIDETAVIEDYPDKSSLVWLCCTGIDKKPITKKISIKGNREKFCDEAIFQSFKLLLTYIKQN